MRERMILNFAYVHVLDELTLDVLEVMSDTGIEKLVIHLYH
jgi:hypothetical protein